MFLAVIRHFANDGLLQLRIYLYFQKEQESIKILRSFSNEPNSINTIFSDVLAFLAHQGGFFTDRFKQILYYIF